MEQVTPGSPSQDIVREIRRAVRNGASVHALADAAGVGHDRARRILGRDSYSQIRIRPQTVDHDALLALARAAGVFSTDA